MAIQGKELSDYIRCITLPVGIMVLLHIVSFVLTLITPLLSLSGILVFLIDLLLMLWIGWSMVKSSGGNLINSAIAGAFAGVILGIVGIVLGVLFVIITVSPPLLETTLIVMLIAGVAGLVIDVIIGAVVAVIGAFIARNIGGRRGL